MKITRRDLRSMIAEAYRTEREQFYDGGEYEEQQDLLRDDDDSYEDEFDYGRDQAFEHVPQAVESFLQKYPDLVDIRGMVEHALTTGDPDDENEQMMKIGARLAMMAKSYPEMAEAMLEELQDQ